jgi:hypothetical protein
LKEPHTIFLFFFQKPKPVALHVVLWPNSSQIRGIPLPSFGWEESKAEHVYQEEK